MTRKLEIIFLFDKDMLSNQVKFSKLTTLLKINQSAGQQSASGNKWNSTQKINSATQRVLCKVFATLTVVFDTYLTKYYVLRKI